MPTPHPATATVLDILTRINTAWRTGHPQEMAPYLDEHVVMAFPGFVGHLEGRQALIESFAEFEREAHVTATNRARSASTARAA
jgi:hypothetical protein